MTMSLSVARPIFSDPGGGGAEDPGRRIFSIEVPRFDVDVAGVGDGPIWVGKASGGSDGGVGLLRGPIGGGWVGGRGGGWVDGG